MDPLVINDLLIRHQSFVFHLQFDFSQFHGLYNLRLALKRDFNCHYDEEYVDGSRLHHRIFHHGRYFASHRDFKQLGDLSLVIVRLFHLQN
jgi:hypothetical protein